VYLLIYNTWESSPQIAQFQIGTLPQQAVYVRAQHDPVNKLDMIEAWDINGNRISSNSFPVTSETDSGTSFQIGYGNEPLMSMAFMRVHSTLVPMNSQPPVTVNNLNRVLERRNACVCADAVSEHHRCYPDFQRQLMGVRIDAARWLSSGSKRYGQLLAGRFLSYGDLFLAAVIGTVHGST
jgi:hypothetical protein